MSKIEVTLNAFYGYSCSGCCYDSEETIEVEVTDMELKAIQNIHESEVSRNEVLDVIENGDSLLQSLHDKLDRACYHMVEEYWLFEADNECIEDCLTNALEKDVDNGDYSLPVSMEAFMEQLKDGEIDFNSLRLGGYFDDSDDDYDFDDEEDLQCRYDVYVLNQYYDWVCNHDHEFIAERVGLDLDACREENSINYTIYL